MEHLQANPSTLYHLYYLCIMDKDTLLLVSELVCGLCGMLSAAACERRHSWIP